MDIVMKDRRVATAGVQPRRRGLLVSIGVNIVLVLLVGGLGLYAFMLNVDLGDLKRRMSKEVEARQQADRYLVETRNQLTESLRENEQLKAQLAYKEADYQSVAAAAQKTTFPAVVSFRASMLGMGQVAVIDNTSNRYIAVMLSVRNPAQSTAKTFRLDLEPRSRTEFGHFEGWEFSPGDELTLRNDEFGSIRLTVP